MTVMKLISLPQHNFDSYVEKCYYLRQIQRKRRENMKNMNHNILIVFLFLILVMALSGSSNQLKPVGAGLDTEHTPTSTSTAITPMLMRKTEVTMVNPTPIAVSAPTLTPRPTPTPTPTPIPYVKCSENGPGYICFGDYYKELPKTAWKDVNITPRYIILHWDGRPEKPYDKWLSTGTWFGLGSTKSSHFGVGLDGVGQFLPMFMDSVKQSKAADNWTMDARSINIEIAGRNFNAIVTGEANEEMRITIETVTNRTLELVLKLMDQYNIPIENVLGHYQVLDGKVDPGDLWLQEYFLPKLRDKLKDNNFQNRLYE